jgi:hypothetical protein
MPLCRVSLIFHKVEIVLLKQVTFVTLSETSSCNLLFFTTICYFYFINVRCQTILLFPSIFSLGFYFVCLFSVALCRHVGTNGTAHLKSVSNGLNTNSYSYLETSGGQSSNLYLNVVHFFNTSVNCTPVAD